MVTQLWPQPEGSLIVTVEFWSLRRQVSATFPPHVERGEFRVQGQGQSCTVGICSVGVSIIIPKGAIPGSVQQEIYFKVCQDNSILPPLDREKGGWHWLDNAL